jgi:cytoskeletal protein CcmA (bactofilin family)
MTKPNVEILNIDGTIEGFIWAAGFDVTIGPTATIVGDICARQITVFGTVSGTLEASEGVDIRQSSRVTGRVVAARLVLADGAWFTGTATR